VFLATQPPFDGDAVLRFLTARAIDGVETVQDGTYRRTLALEGGDVVVSLTPRADGVVLDGEAAAAPIARALFGLDQDPAAVRAALGDDPVLGPLVRARPGLRIPGGASGFEVAVRAVVGQQITVAAARTLLGRIAARTSRAHGDLLLFPEPAALAAAPDDVFTMPRTRARTLRELAAADPPLATPDDARALTRLYGIGPWTAGYVALRLGDPDVFLEGDVAVRTSLKRLGATTADAPRWAPHRSHAVLQLWANLANPAPGVPTEGGVSTQTG
jgi:AraC family transcriptional regulator, regulatory protein of adaptative response / DNA-3-methyladenine glycosylase II